MERTGVFTQEVSIRAVILYMPRALVGFAVLTHSIYLRLPEEAGQGPVLVVVPPYVEELDATIRELFENSLALRAWRHASDFEFLAIPMPLIEGLEYLHRA
jgi:hypothetical protein